LDRIEDFTGELLEGFFRRRFATALQPVEIAKDLVREMVRNKIVSVKHIYVPNCYCIYLSARDGEQFSVFEQSLSRELASFLKQKAAEKDYTLVGMPCFTFTVDEDLAPGTLRIECSFNEEVEELSENEAKKSDTLDYPERVEEPLAQDWQLLVVEGPDEGKVFQLTEKLQIIGRHSNNEIFLSDPNVSRKHAELEYIRGSFFLTDLGSTNGIVVNDNRVARQRLYPGDRLKLGQTVLELRVN
jgi:hypothetical protein